MKDSLSTSRSLRLIVVSGVWRAERVASDVKFPLELRPLSSFGGDGPMRKRTIRVARSMFPKEFQALRRDK